MADGSVYPGSEATANNIICLAEGYRRTAQRLLEERPMAWRSEAPGRLCGVHAIELYLNAFLLDRGLTPEEIRASGHDLGRKAGMTAAAGLTLKRRTARHLETMTEEREYLGLRYDPDMTSSSQINRVLATLDEVSGKVKQALAGRPVPPRGTPAG
jgi:hypothetical protein